MKKKNNLTAAFRNISMCMLYITAIAVPELAHAQKNYSSPECLTVLKKISAKLASLQKISYISNREFFYKDENYHAFSTTDLYINFLKKENPLGFLFQAHTDKYSSRYNGIQYFTLNYTNKTIDILQKPDSKKMESASALYYSFASLRKILPEIHNNSGILKTMSDTVISRKKYYLFKITLNNKYIGNLGHIEDFGKEYTGDKIKPYELVVEKENLIPVQFTSRFNDKPDNFIQVKYDSIKLNPKEPEELSWYYSTYTNEFTPPKPAKPLISPGSIITDHTLSVYLPGKTDSVSLRQYRGKVVMLDFWIKSCGPCIASFPKLNELQKKYGSDKFHLLSVNTEDKEEDIAFFYRKHSPQYKMLFNGEKLAGYCGVSYFPTVILLDKSGTVIYAGGFDKEKIEGLIEQSL